MPRELKNKMNLNYFSRPTRPWAQPQMSQAAATALGLTRPPVVKEKIHWPCEEYGQLTITPIFIAEILRRADCSEIATATEIKALLKLQTNYEAMDEILLDNTYDRTREKYKQQMTEFSQKLSTLTPLEIAAVTTRTSDELQADALSRRKQIKQKLRDISASAVPFYKIIVARIEAAAKRVATAIEHDERAEMARFGLDWCPSLICASAWQLSWRLSKDAPNIGISTPPKLLLQGVPINWKWPEAKNQIANP
jgi:hypothetical protein